MVHGSTTRKISFPTLVPTDNEWRFGPVRRAPDGATVPKLLTIDEVAVLARAPRSSVLDWVYRGKLESVKLGRKRLVAVQALRAFIEANTSIVACDRVRHDGGR